LRGLHASFKHDFLWDHRPLVDAEVVGRHPPPPGFLGLQDSFASVVNCLITPLAPNARVWPQQCITAPREGEWVS
jgi:hypothetical protein